MNDSNSDFGVMTNCNTFVAVRKTTAENGPVFHFSPSIEAANSPTLSNLCWSPFGLLMGISIFALSERGVNIMSGRAPSASAVMKHIVTGLHHFDPLPVSRGISHPKEHNRHATYQQVSSFVCQLGPAVFFLSFSQGYPNDNKEVWPGTFHGPCNAEPGELCMSLADRQCDDFSWIPSLQVSDLVAQGHFWNVWTFSFAWAHGSKPDIVIRWGRVRPCNLNRIAEEVKLLREPLATLEGHVVPRFYGLFGSIQPEDDEQWCMVFDFAGETPCEKERSSQNLRNQIRRQYTRLHKAGIVHNNVEWRHILVLAARRAASTVLLVDFSNARSKGSMGLGEWKDLCKREMADVETLLLPYSRSVHCVIE
ncbi:hypothetical protein CspeluHIS016_0900650 [Cutaneotrichosporon spelunceum]|uniref:Protein kinase domain-containing protein n=1 Tax=Cutaneotrichosporon spelunceum TaxID=1672016 RepID=A0AAD3TZN7_9TREE|nr:hypothetical protein CspeluHIS016_0900650 [Cutaneotrichosporon spelunceum]